MNPNPEPKPNPHLKFLGLDTFRIKYKLIFTIFAYVAYFWPKYSFKLIFTFVWKCSKVSWADPLFETKNKQKNIFLRRECILTLFKGISLRDDFVRTFDSILRFNRQDKRHFFLPKSGTKKIFISKSRLTSIKHTIATSNMVNPSCKTQPNSDTLSALTKMSLFWTWWIILSFYYIWELCFIGVSLRFI